MALQLNPYAVLLLITLIPYTIIFLFLLPRSRNRVIYLFLLMQMLSIALALAYTGELMSVDLSTKLMWIRFKYIFHTAIPAAFLFTLAFAGFGHLINTRFVVKVMIVPLVGNILVWTNDYHHLIWLEAQIDYVSGYSYFRPVYGWGFWLYMVFNSMLILLASYFVLYRITRPSSLYRGQMFLLVLSLLMPFAGFFMRFLPFNPVPMLNLGPFALTLSSIPIGIALIRYKLLDLLPAAYNRILDSIGDGVLICDAELRVVEANRAALQLCNCESDQIVNRPLQVLLPAAVSVIDAHLQLQEANTLPNSFQDEAGRILDIRLFPLDLSSRANYHAVVINDITLSKQAEQKKLEVQIERERQQILETFIQNISHDFRTPLTVAVSASSLLRLYIEKAQSILLTAPDSAERDQILRELADISATSQQVESVGGQISRLLEQMLRVIDVRSRPPELLAEVDLSNWLEAVRLSVMSQFEAKNVVLCVHAAQDLPPAPVDASELAYALRCLLENAVQHTPQGGLVDLHAYMDVADLIIKVCDTGVGTAPEHHVKTFDEFCHEDNSEQSMARGGDLGLMIARLIAESHKGTISVQSAPDAGSEFVMRIPTQLA